MIKQFVKDIGIYGFSGIMVRMISFFLIPFYVRVLSTEDYGIIDLVTLVSSISGVVLSLEIYQAIARFFPESEEEKRKTYASTGLFFYLFTYIVFTITVSVFARPLSKLIFSVSDKEEILRLAVVAILITSIFNYFQNLLRYSLKSVKYSISNILYSLATVLFSICFVILQKKGLKGVYLGQIAGGSIGLALTFWYNLKYIAFSINFKVLKRMLRFSIPLVSSGLAIYSLTYIDRILIQRFLSLSELGIYGVSYRIASIPIVFMGIINASLIPVVYSEYQNEAIKSDLEKIYRIVFFIGFTGITVISIFSFELLGIVTTAEYLPAYKIMPFLLLSTFLMQFSNMFPGLSIAEKTKYIAFIYMLGFAVSLVANICLIPHIGILGAAVSSSFVAVLIFLLQIFFSQKYYYIDFHFGPILRCALLSVLAISSVYILPAQNSVLVYFLKAVITSVYLFVCFKLSGFKNLFSFTKLRYK